MCRTFGCTGDAFNAQNHIDTMNIVYFLACLYVMVVGIGSAVDGRRLASQTDALRRPRADHQEHEIEAAFDHASVSRMNRTVVMTKGDVYEQGCPEISLRETSVMIRESRLPLVTSVGPLFQIKTQCATNDGQVFDPVYTSLRDYSTVLFGGYRFIRVSPDAVVGRLKCGQQLTCSISAVSTYSSFVGREYELFELASGSCDFDYRNFIQWGYKQQGLGFTCSEGSAFYTLMCEECQYEDFPWERAYNMSGPILEDSTSSSSPSFNYIMVITAVSVVGFAILVSFVAVLIRSRRRSAIDLRVAEMVSRDATSRRESQKPPELFIVSENDEGCLPSSEYDGPIVVFNASNLRNPASEDPTVKGEDDTPSAHWSLPQIAVLDIDPTENEDENEDGDTQGSGSGSSSGPSVAPRSLSNDQSPSASQQNIDDRRSQSTGSVEPESDNMDDGRNHA